MALDAVGLKKWHDDLPMTFGPGIGLRTGDAVREPSDDQNRGSEGLSVRHKSSVSAGDRKPSQQSYQCIAKLA